MTQNAASSALAAGTIKIGSLTVNRLGFGAMRITGEGVWGPPADLESAKQVLQRAVELDVNFIDTADAYGPNVSEELIHDALYPYEGLLIATKGGLLRGGPGDWQPNGTPEHLREACHGSLQRLDVKQIALYQFHRPDPAVSFTESIQALAELQAEGSIRHIGLSNVSLDQLKAALEITPIVSVQNHYNVLHRQDSEAVLQFCAEHGIAFIPYFPMGGGYYDPQKLQAVADKQQVTTQQIALAWLLAHSPAMLPIPGTASIEHLEANLAAASIKLDSDDMKLLDRLDPA